MATQPILVPLGDDGRLTVEGRASIEKNGKLATAGYFLVVIRATPSNRFIEVAGYLNGYRVAAATAADNHLAGVISSPEQSFTMPVPINASYQIVANTKTGVSIWWISGL